MRFASLLLAVWMTAPCLADENWAEFRGPGGTGHSSATGLPLKFGEGENVTWKTPIHGKAWSSPVVWGNQIWLTTATEDGKKLSALCVDLKSGEILKDLVVFEIEEPQYCHPMNSYATPTPVIEEGRVYVHFGAHGTACLDTETGEKLWVRQDLPCNHFRGPASSPVMQDDVLVIHFDGFDYQYVAALNKETGETAWKHERDLDYGTDNGDRKKAYATPLIFQHEGKNVSVSPGAVATMAYDIDSGQELWRVIHGGMNAAARPLVGNGLVYICTGPAGCLAVKPGGSGDVTKSHVAWTFSKSVPKRGTPLLVGKRMFMINDGGVASWIDALTGEVIWQKRVGGEFVGSPILAEGRIYAFSREGDCPVFAASDDYELLAENKLEDGFMASPAVADGALILRSTTHLYRVEK